jgi:glycosyltransferase involved in cell wall biosynthesis
MKILEVLGEGPWGGGSVVVLSIVDGLLARGDEVWVACREGENARRFREAGAKVVNPPLWFHPINPLDAVPFLYLAGLCFRERFDLVATHTSKGGFVGRLAARVAGMPHIVHHAHGFSYNKVLGPLARKFFVGLERFAARAGDFIISVNDQHRAMAVELGVAEAARISTVHNGVDFTPHRRANGAAARKKLGFPETDLLVGTTGRLAPQKGFVYLVRAMPHILASLPSARLIVVGEGPLEEELKQEARQSGVADRVHFLGFRHDVPELLAAFDVYALPSLWEGLSISLIEALAAGKPIVATSIDGNAEAIEHMKTGLMVPPADPAALAEGIRTLLADRDLAAALARPPRRSAEVRFSIERMVEQNLAVYDSVVSGARGGAAKGRSWKGSGIEVSTGRSGATGM